MKNGKKATSIVEAMVVMLIIVSGVTGMYSIYIESIRLSNSTANKIQAIEISRQGIEAFSNIRDTNWLLFSSDYKNCWNTLHYETNCIGAINTDHTIPNNTKFIIYKNTNNRWDLSDIPTNTDTFGTGTYINDFKVSLDNGIYTQSGGVDFLPTFTREIYVSYTGDNLDETDPYMIITSLVQWVDNSSDKPHKVELVKKISNWKK